MLTAHHIVQLSPHSLALELVIGYRSNLAQVTDTRIPSSELLRESSQQTCTGKLGILVCNYTSTFVYVSYICGIKSTRYTIERYGSTS